MTRRFLQGFFRLFPRVNIPGQCFGLFLFFKTGVTRLGDQRSQLFEKSRHLPELLRGDHRHFGERCHILFFITPEHLRLLPEPQKVGSFKENLPGRENGDALSFDEDRHGAIHEPVRAGLDHDLSGFRHLPGQMDITFAAIFCGEGAPAVELRTNIPPTRSNQDFHVGNAEESDGETHRIGEMLEDTA